MSALLAWAQEVGLSGPDAVALLALVVAALALLGARDGYLVRLIRGAPREALAEAPPAVPELEARITALEQSTTQLGEAVAQLTQAVDQLRDRLPEPEGPTVVDALADLQRTTAAQTSAISAVVDALQRGQTGGDR